MKCIINRIKKLFSTKKLKKTKDLNMSKYKIKGTISSSEKTTETTEITEITKIIINSHQNYRVKHEDKEWNIFINVTEKESIILELNKEFNIPEAEYPFSTLLQLQLAKQLVEIEIEIEIDNKKKKYKIVSIKVSS